MVCNGGVMNGRARRGERSGGAQGGAFTQRKALCAAAGSIVILQVCDMGRQLLQSRPPREVELDHFQGA